ncbi:MAG: HEPN domain-containing protein [Campylobacterota bacterium]|nr:HEPN domain-containing protein [Campylobacterota bacterium]
MNKQSAKEWLTKAWHNLSGAKIFYDVNHYTDVTAVELHYAVEKILKSFLANQNKKIPKTHDLIDIYELIKKNIDLEEHKFLLDQITEYHIEESYPAFDRKMPPREEIKVVLDFALELFEKVCTLLDIDSEEVKI